MPKLGQVVRKPLLFFFSKNVFELSGREHRSKTRKHIGLGCTGLYRAKWAIWLDKGWGNPDRTSFLKQYVAGERVDLLDDYDFPARTITETRKHMLLENVLWAPSFQPLSTRCLRRSIDSVELESTEVQPSERQNTLRATSGQAWNSWLAFWKELDIFASFEQARKNSTYLPLQGRRVSILKCGSATRRQTGWWKPEPVSVWRGGQVWLAERGSCHSTVSRLWNCVAGAENAPGGCRRLQTHRQKIHKAFRKVWVRRTHSQTVLCTCKLQLDFPADGLCLHCRRLRSFNFSEEVCPWTQRYIKTNSRFRNACLPRCAADEWSRLIVPKVQTTRSLTALVDDCWALLCWWWSEHLCMCMFAKAGPDRSVSWWSPRGPWPELLVVNWSGWRHLPASIGAVSACQPIKGRRWAKTLGCVAWQISSHHPWPGCVTGCVNSRQVDGCHMRNFVCWHQQANSFDPELSSLLQKMPDSDAESDSFSFTE